MVVELLVTEFLHGISTMANGTLADIPPLFTHLISSVFLYCDYSALRVKDTTNIKLHPQTFYVCLEK